MFLRILIVVLGALISFILFKKIVPKHRRIDTESIAVVKEVIDLGRIDAKKEYAVRYEIQSSKPFDLLETPVHKPRDIGETRSIFYEEADPKNNFYFKKIGSIDFRLGYPIFFTIGTICAIISLFVL